MKYQLTQRNNSILLHQEQGYSLLELMVVVAIMALLSTLAVPTYQYYLQKTALVQAVQASLPHKVAVSLCALELGVSADGRISDACRSGEYGIPASEVASSSHLQSIKVEPQGRIRITGQGRLQGLEIILIPELGGSGGLSWQTECVSTADPGLISLCQKTFS